MSDSGSSFQKKYMEFADDLRGALPEYSTYIDVAIALDDNTKLTRFQQEVKAIIGDESDLQRHIHNPGCVLPGVIIEDSLWSQLSEHTQKAIWEHIQVLSICCFLESGFNNETVPPEWMDQAMNEMKQKLESSDFQNMFGKFMDFFKTAKNDSSDDDDGDEKGASTAAASDDNPFGAAGFPKIPERFMKGHIARLAQEIVKEITPADLGLTDDMIAECEKDPSRAFHILFGTFSSNPAIIQQTITKIGNRLKQKVMSGSIRPQEIAKEAEELMKEFMDNKPFVQMMNGMKNAFGFGGDSGTGKGPSTRMSNIKDRLRKKLEKKKQTGGKK